MKKLQLVIANILHTRRHQVIFVTPEKSFSVNLSPEELNSGVEIEESIVKNVIMHHEEHIRKYKLENES